MQLLGGGADSIQGEGDGQNTIGDRHYTMWGGTIHSGGRTPLNGGDENYTKGDGHHTRGGKGTDTMMGGSRHYTGCRIESVHPPVRLLSVFSEKGGQCLRFFACMRVYLLFFGNFELFWALLGLFRVAVRLKKNAFWAYPCRLIILIL